MFQGRRGREQKNVSTDVIEEAVPALPTPEGEGTAVQHALPTTAAQLVSRDELASASRAVQGKSGGAILGRGCRFEGKLSFDGTVQIDGEFYGDIESSGHLVVSQGARIDGTISVSSAIVSGKVSGKVITTGTLELTATSSLVGELVVESLVIEKGAHFQGEVKMNGGQKV